MISIEHLTFDYGNFLALDDINVQIPRGSITALVGPNGAGKSTLMRCLAALSRPTSGRVLINDIDTVANPHGCHAITGFLADNFGLYEALTVQQSLTYFARAHGVEYTNRVAEVIEMVNLADKTNAPIKSLSRGMRQRVGIAQAIIHGPEFVILDEPASGLDPEARIQLASLFKQLNRGGITLIVSSHILAELDQYANNLIVLKNGRIVETGFELSRVQNAEYQHYVICVDNISLLKTIDFAGLCSLSGIDGNNATVVLPAGEKIKPVLDLLREKGVDVLEFYKSDSNIQDAYLKTIKNA